MAEATSMFEKVPILYHGSKSGLIDSIQPKSRNNCDFGKGFYMGTSDKQVLTLICNFDNAMFYEVAINTSNLQVIHLQPNLQWAMFIALNRGRLEHFQTTSFYKKLEKMRDEYDVIIGPIADDRMFVVLDQFFAGTMTDVALINCLLVLNLGEQWVAKTTQACKQIKILTERVLTDNEKAELSIARKKSREHALRETQRISRDHRRDGKFFDELIEELFV